MTPTEQKAFDQMRDTFKPFEKLFKQMTDVHPTPTNFDCQIAVRDLRALIYSFDDLTAANAVSDHFRSVTEMVQPLGWYCVSRDGLATQCADQRDAELTAKSANRDWPNSAPYRAVQLCEFEANPQATEPADQDSLMEKAYERGWIECACWANRDDLRADVGSPAYLADRAPHLDAVKNGWPLGCEKCIDPDGIPCFPQYGVGPHTCFYKIPGAKVGESQPLPKDQWPDNYREDPDCPGMGVYWCPHCGSGKPAPEAKQ